MRTSSSHRIRQFHRWVSIAFTLAVAANFAAMTRGRPPAWVTYSPLIPLALLLLTGLYLFVLPYVARRDDRPLPASPLGTGSQVSAGGARMPGSAGP